MQIEVVRSARRVKTVQARMVGNTLRISIPAHLSASDEAQWVERMTQRVAAKRRSENVDLAQRSAHLATRFDLPRPASVDWSDRQLHRWGSCTPDTGAIRISRRVADLPPWVLDYVLMHELAHLVVAGHDATFWALVDRYPLAERARGYLMAVADGSGGAAPQPHVPAETSKD